MSRAWQTIAGLEKEGRLPMEASPLPFVCEKYLSLSDLHFPFQDRNLEESIFNLLQARQFDGIIYNGDALDFYDISRFASKHHVPIEVEQQAWLNHITIVRSLHDKRIDFTPGNHEKRFEAYIRSDAPKLAGLKYLELPNFLECDNYDVTMHPDEGFMLAPEFMVYHGETVRKYAGWSARGEMEKFGISGSSGHTHRMGQWVQTNTRGTQVWTEEGCLCTMRPEYITGTPNWQQGCVVHLKYGDNVHTVMVPVVEGKLLYEGELF